MSHDFDEPAPLKTCRVCGEPLYEEDDIFILKDFSHEGEDGVFCRHHYEQMTIATEDGNR